MPVRVPLRELADWSYTDEEHPWRHLATAMLIGACLGAANGDSDDIAWIKSSASRLLAELIELRAWPPRPEHLATLRQMVGPSVIRSGMLRRTPSPCKDLDMVAAILNSDRAGAAEQC